MASVTPAEKLAKQKRAEAKTPDVRCELRAVRLALGLTLDDVSEAAGVSKGNLCRLEYGGDVQLTTARKLAEFFGKTIDELWPTT